MKGATVTCFIGIFFVLTGATTLADQTDGSGKDYNESKAEQFVQLLKSRSPLEKSRAIRGLLQHLAFKEKIGLTEETKEIIEAEFRQHTNKETILLAGLAEVESVSEEIKQWASLPLQEPETGRFYGTRQWAAALVLARKGDKPTVIKLLDFAKKQDLHTQVVFLLKDFQYVPQPEVVEYLNQYLESDERLEPVKSTVQGLPVANYAASALAVILQGFPVAYKEDYSYSEEEIHLCRQWMSTQKHWQFR